MKFLNKSTVWSKQIEARKFRNAKLKL